MNTRYLILFFCISVISAYFCGAKIADVKCRASVVKKSLEMAEQQTKQILQNQRIVHEKVYKTGVVDIRHILQSKYTIAE